jgi:protein subunit release factor B
MRTKINLVNKDDLVIQTFRAGGSGGQNQNKRNTGVRIKHPASGAVGEARDSRHQHQNRKAAFERMVASKRFQSWMRIQLGKESVIEASVDQSIRDATDLKVERRVGGRWEVWDESLPSR